MMQLVVLSKREKLYQKILEELEEECFSSDVLHAHSLSEALELLNSQNGIVVTDPESFPAVKRHFSNQDMQDDTMGPVRVDGEGIVDFVRYYVRTHLNKDISLTAMAGRCGVSSNYLSTLFHRETGTSFQHFVDESRMQKAAYLLETEDCLIFEVANKVGYACCSYFCKVFKNCFGETPKQYRANHTLNRL